MATKKRIQISILVVMIWVLTSLVVKSEAIAINIIARPGVSQGAVQDIRQGVGLLEGYFLESYGVRLQRDVTIYLTANEREYAKELQAQFALSPAEAKRRAQTTRGWARDSLIISNIAALPNVTERMYHVAHEMAHQYQFDFAPHYTNQVQWLAEGWADVIAAQVIARSGKDRVENYNRKWWDVVRKAKRLPELNQLQTPSGWYQAIAGYGTEVTYRTAGIAATLLIERSGPGAMLEYYRLFNQSGNPEQSFRQAFGISQAEFSQEVQRYLNKQRNQ